MIVENDMKTRRQLNNSKIDSNSMNETFRLNYEQYWFLRSNREFTFPSIRIQIKFKKRSNRYKRESWSSNDMMNSHDRLQHLLENKLSVDDKIPKNGRLLRNKIFVIGFPPNVRESVNTHFQWTTAHYRFSLVYWKGSTRLFFELRSSSWNSNNQRWAWNNERVFLIRSIELIRFAKTFV